MRTAEHCELLQLFTSLDVRSLDVRVLFKHQVLQYF